MTETHDSATPTPSAPAGSGTGAAIKTLLLSDLVDSTKLVERLGDERAFAIFGRHDRVARDLLHRHNGREIDKTDGFLLLFDRPIDALGYALDYHRGLAELSREEQTEIASRVGIHLGEVYLRENRPEDVARGAKPLEVEGLAKPVAARLMSLAMGGQILLTQAAFDLARRASVGEEGAGEAEVQWLAHGAYRFKGVDEPVKVFEAGLPGLAPLQPPPGSAKVQRVTGDETVLGWRPAPGQEIPHRANWRLVSKLGEGGFGEVWLARHRKTSDQRVYKFCFDEERLRGLQREVTLFRLLKDALGNRDDIARIIDWNFDQAPYFVESEYSEGGSVLDWAVRHDGIEAMPLPTRLQLVAQVAEALAAAHSVGVLHKDLKPANVLVHEGSGNRIQARLTDFGIGLVTDHDRLSSSGITMLGFTETAMVDDELAMSGTQLYMAPEMLEGKLPTVQADIYALGVMLFQLVVGDLRRALAPGWERDVPDELLREDIAALVDGSPQRRLSDAGEAARRLQRLEERRAEREAEARARAEAEQARLALQRAQKRRKLVAAVVVSLTVFAVAMGVQSWRIAREAERAEREAETARQVSEFLLALFEEAKPEKVRGQAITARDLVDQGAERVEQELEDQPQVRARITQMLGNVYFTLGSYDRAETFYEETITLQQQHLQQVDVGVATSLMNLAAAFMQQGRIEEARTSFERALAIKEERLGHEHPEVAALLSNLAVLHRRQKQFEEGLALAERALAIYEKEKGPDDSFVAKVLTNVANLQGDLGRYEAAESSLQRSLEILERNEGPDHPQVATALESLATISGLLEQRDKQETLYRRALQIRTKVLGDEHPLVAFTLFKLGTLRTLRGDAVEGQELLERALGMAQAKLGAGHTAVADILVSLADAERVQGRLGEAEGHAEQARAIFRAAAMGENPDDYQALQVLGQVRHDSGRLDEAGKLLERSLAHAESARGPDHPDIAAICHRLGIVYRDQGRIGDATVALRRALEIRERSLGADHPAVAALRREVPAE